MNRQDALPAKRLRQALTVGNIWLYILSLIKSKKEVYAYSLVTDIELKFGFKPGRVMIYLVLYKLEGEKIIESTFKERRKYYKMTAKGQETLNLAKKYLAALAKKL
ncbi:MAG: PadR family transcriptional regulator [Candidatus Micrarchaeota archaeon]